jgi:hypothetical protein
VVLAGADGWPGPVVAPDEDGLPFTPVGGAIDSEGPAAGGAGDAGGAVAEPDPVAAGSDEAEAGGAVAPDELGELGELGDPDAWPR